MSTTKAKRQPRATDAAVRGQSRQMHVVDTVVKEGDLITFGPTGEQVRVTKIEGDVITFEKTP